MKYQEAKDLAESLLENIQRGCLRAEIVGSVKRADKPEVHDIEILCIPDPKAPVPVFGSKVIFKNRLDEVLAGMEMGGYFMGRKLDGEKMKKFLLKPSDNFISGQDFFLDLFIVREETWAIQNVIRTGPSEFSHRFVTNKRMGGLLPDKYEYIRGETKIRELGGNGIIELHEEKDAIALLGLGWIEPKARRAYV